MVSCCKEVGHMNDTLKQLYNRFYIPLPMAEAEQEIEACHKQLCLLYTSDAADD